MAGAKPLEVEIDEDQYDAVMSAVATGGYASTSEVVGEALTEWLESRTSNEIDAERLCKLCEEGLASGSFEPFDPEAIKRKAQEAFRSGR